MKAREAQGTVAVPTRLVGKARDGVAGSGQRAAPPSAHPMHRKAQNGALAAALKGLT